MEYSSSLVVLAVVMTVVELVAGVAIGWWLRGSQPVKADEASSDEVQKARAALNTLHELATRVAADVGEHSSKVQAITTELTNQAGEDGALDSAVLGTVAQIIEANAQLQAQLKSAEVKLQEQAVQIEVHAADALTDALTGRANRRAFDTELTRRLSEWERKNTPFCLMMIDVDHFKKFNDTHGHLAGDEVLRGVGRNLSEKLREMDFVARYGGEEFAVIMPSSPLMEAEPGAARTCSHIESCQFEFEGKTLKVTVSGGLAQAQQGEDSASLIKRSDEALYAAKKAGRNRVYAHDGQTVRPIGGAKVGPPEPPAKAPAPKPAPASAASAATPAADPFRTDAQTGLPNRTSFCEEVRRRVAESHRFGTNLSLLLVKVDNFARQSSKFGPPAVELIVRTVSQFLTAGMREMDLVARYNDDVFAVLLPGTPLPQAVGVGERLRGAVARCPLRGKDFELRISVSAGLSEIERSDDSAALLKRCESAMQTSVQAGGDSTHFHSGKGIERFTLKEAHA